MAGGGPRTQTDASWIAFHLLTLAMRATRCPPLSLGGPATHTGGSWPWPLAAGRRHVGPLPSKPGEVRRLWRSQLPCYLGLVVFHGVLKTGLPLRSPPGQTDWYLEESACTKLTLSLASSGWLFFLRNKKVTHVWRSSDYWLLEDCLASGGGGGTGKAPVEGIAPCKC